MIKGSDERYRIDNAYTKIYKVYTDYKNILSDNYYPEFQNDLLKFKNKILDLHSNKISATFVHFGDGDYFFLTKQPVGSAQPKKRALSVSYDNFNIKPFVKGFIKNDYICVEYFEKQNRKRVREIYPDIKIDYPTEFLYGLLSSKWFFKNFPNNISLIGAKEKLNIIKDLMKHDEYKEYLGIDKFQDYIEIPQKFACDNLKKVCLSVEEQMRKSDSKNEFKIFLCGMGHVKSGLFHKLKKYGNGLFIDVGGGIDALAGIVDHNRPYMGTWVNYHMKGYDYSKIDFLQYNMKKDKLKKQI